MYACACVHVCVCKRRSLRLSYHQSDHDMMPSKKNAHTLLCGTFPPCPRTNTIFSQVKEGQAVVKGEILVILESMKMETKVYALADGTVARLNVKEGTCVFI